MFKREIRPLPETVAEAISKSINKLQYVEEKASRPADRTEGDEKTQDITGEEPVKTDGSATKAPARKGDQSGAEPMQKVKEEAEIDEALKKFPSEADDIRTVNSLRSKKRTSFGLTTKEKGQLARAENRLRSQGHSLKKEEVEITELHMSLLEAHGVEKKMAEKIKKVFDAMSTADKAAFMKSYLKNPKAANEYMADQIMKGIKAAGGMNLGEAMDAVDAKALKGKHSERKDKDIDNDGDVDSSDEYLHKRRQAISKAMKKEEVELDENDSKDKYRKASYIDMVVSQIPQKDVKKLEAEMNKHSLQDLKAKGAKHWKDLAIRMRNEEVELEEVDTSAEKKLEESITKMPHGRLKFHMNNKSVPHGSYSWDQMKAERDRRLKAGEGEAYKKAKMSMSEEVEQIDEARWEYKGDKTYMVGGNLRYDDKIEYKLSKANADILNNYMKQAKSDAERSKVWTMFWDSKETGDKATGPEKAIAFAKKAIKEEVELDEQLSSNKGEAKEINGKRHVGKILLWNEKEFAEIYAHAGTSQTKRTGSRIATSQKKVVRWGFRLIGMKAPNYAMTTGFSSRDEAEEAALNAYKKAKGLNEAKSATGYTINHKTFSAAVQHAKAQAEKQGYTIDDDEWDRKVAMGPKKPGTGKTNRYTIDLMKGGKETRRKLQMQVYYDEGRYELNMYIS